MMALLFMTLLAILVWFWQHSLALRERAIARCRKTCKELNVQFLDQTVSLIAIFPRWNKGALVLVRRYNFEFSHEGIDRYKGYVVMTGSKVNHLQLEHPEGDIIINQDQRDTLH